jgi:hypothetical protein
MYIGDDVNTVGSHHIPVEAHWVSTYIMKSIVRLTTMKQLKNNIGNVEIIVPESLDYVLNGGSNRNNP